MNQPLRTGDDVRFKTAIGSFRTPEFVGGMTGLGGRIDEHGDAEMQSLKLRGFLEVPELRYNRVEISMGDTWYAPSAGIIESVDTEAQTITLKLEEGEIGSPRVGDICMGIFHNLNTSENATADYDDGRGNRRFAGFATCYFRITEELDTATYKTFKYQLRPASGTYPTQYHPAASMTFVGYGSFSNEDRQTSRYETRTYQRYLTGVSDWEFTASNIAAQYGDLSNLSVFGINMTGYSAYLNNIYMSGVIHQFTPGGEEVPTIIDRGVWSATETYNRNDDVYWNNGHWRCLVDGTKTEPGKDAEEWVYLGGYGVLETVSIFKKSENEPAKPTELKIPPEGWTTETLPMSDQRPTWMCTGTVVDGEVKSWSAPQRVSGEPGSDGKDGKDYEWIFARTSQYKAPAQPPTAQQDDYIPSSSETSDGQVWTDDAVGPDSDLLRVGQQAREGKWHVGQIHRPCALGKIFVRRSAGCRRNRCRMDIQTHKFQHGPEYAVWQRRRRICTERLDEQPHGPEFRAPLRMDLRTL